MSDRDAHDRAQALPKIKRSARKVERLQEELEVEIVAAVAEGHSLRAVAAAAGRTPEGIRQLLKRRQA